MSRFTSLLSTSAATLALGAGLFAASPSLAQHHGGGHGGGGYHGDGGYHGGGGFRGHRGGFYSGFYGGFLPGFGYGYGYGYGYDAFDPYWGFDYESAPFYSPEAYAVAPPSVYYQAQPAGPSADQPYDNSRGFYLWQLGVEGGTCNRPYLQQIAASLTGVPPASLQNGATLGGIPVQRVIGGRIGSRLDITDQACATEALEHTPTGTPVRWQSAAGIPVTFIVTRSEDRQGGQICRDFETTAQFGSQSDKVRNTACKSSDGSWRVTR